MNRKTLIALVSILIFGIIFAVIFTNLRKNHSSQDSNSNTAAVSSDKKNIIDFLLPDFPIKEVPLFKLEKVSSSHIFVNTDPKNKSDFGETNYAYYNVVLYSDSTKDEFLQFYKNLFDKQITDNYDMPDTVKGSIGQYRIAVSHYDVDKTGYIRVYLPSINDKRIEPYFTNFPNILTVSPELVEHEKSYGLLNQKGGEIEFRKYYTVIDSGDANGDGKDDVDEFAKLETEYQTQYQSKPDYSYDNKTGLMKFKDRDYQVTLAISRDHSRIYLMIRKGMNK